MPGAVRSSLFFLPASTLCWPSLHGATESANPGVPIPISHLKEPPSTSSKARLLKPSCQSTRAACCICRFYSSSDDLLPLPSIIHSTTSTGLSPQSIKLSVPGLNNSSFYFTFTSSSRTLLHCTHNPVLQHPNYGTRAKVRYQHRFFSPDTTHQGLASQGVQDFLLPQGHTFFDALYPLPFKNCLQRQGKLLLTCSFTHLSSSRCGAWSP